MKDLNLDEAVELLTRTPATLDTFLRGLPDVWVRGDEGSNTWNAIDIVAHLVFAERTDWIPRVRILLEHGEARPFEPFDRVAHLEDSRDSSLDQLLDEFADLRRESLVVLQALALQPEDLERTGTHPALGTVKLSELMAAWTVHDLTHLHQLSRVLAEQYRELTGPWSAYLGVLQCRGHSAP